MTFTLLVAILLGVNALLAPPLQPGGFMEAMQHKHQRLATLPAPRVVVIGGSNAGFGLDSEELERAFHRPVVNMALHGGLGFEFMVNEVLGGMRKGDLVLVFPEHIQYSTARVAGLPLLSAIDTYPGAITFTAWAQRPRVLFDYATLKLRATRKWLHDGPPEPDSTVYQRTSFNVQGDVVAHLSMRPPGIRSGTGVDLRNGFAIDPRFWTCVDRLLRRADEVGCTVAFGWPCFAESYAVPAVDSLLDRELRSRVPLVIGHPSDYVYPDSMFFDTEYHLGSIGRAIRTDRFLSDARPVLPPAWFRDP